MEPCVDQCMELPVRDPFMELSMLDLWVDQHIELPVRDPCVDQHIDLPASDPRMDQHVERPAVDPCVDQRIQLPTRDPCVGQHIELPCVELPARFGNPMHWISVRINMYISYRNGTMYGIPCEG